MQKIGNLLSTLSKPRLVNAVGVILILSLLGFYIFFTRANLVTTFDDAYMFIRYANNAITGHGIAWNPDGIQTYGATSLLYLLIIVLVRWLFPTVEASHLLTITSASLGILFLITLAIGCARMTHSNFLKKYPLLLSILLAILFLPSPGFLFHTTSGMDTSISLLCNTFLIFTTLGWVKRNDSPRVLLVIASAYASFLARPDNLIYSIMFPSLCMLLSSEEGQIKKTAWFLGGLGFLLLLDTAAKYMIFGDPLPLPFYAKTNGYDDGYAGAFRWNPISYLFDFFRLIFPFIVIIVFSASGNIRKLLLIFFLPVLVTFIYYFSVVQIMGFYARYYFPAIPFFVTAAYLSLDHRLYETTKESQKSGQLFRLAVMTVCAFLLWIPSVKTSLAQAYRVTFIPKAQIYPITVKYSTDSTIPKSSWWESITAISEISIRLPKDTKFALSEYGVVGARAPQINIMDPLGLHDPFFAHHGFSAAEFLDRKPDLIWFPHPDYSKIISSILDDPRFWAEYDYYPQAFDYGLAIRRDSKNYTSIYKAVEDVWKIYYPSQEIEKSIAHPP